jgi:hypothetical protein
MIHELLRTGKNLEHSSRGLIVRYSLRSFREGTEENCESLRIATSEAEIQTGHLPNRGLERYLYVNLLGDSW